jgi:hypothetical protein
MTRRRTPVRRQTSPRKPVPRRRRAISLRYEFGELQCAITGARLLVNIARHQGGDDARERAAALDGCAATLSLLAERLDLLDVVIAHDVEARMALAPYNEVHGSVDELAAVAEQDLLLAVDELEISRVEDEG